MTPRRILVVDDDESLRRVTQVQLEQAGYQVATAPSGADALRLMADSRYDLVITDLKMPGMSGLDLLRAHPRRVPRHRRHHDHRLRHRRERRRGDERGRLRLHHQADRSGGTHARRGARRWTT